MTGREIEIVRLIAEDVPTKAIAARLGLSVKTIEFHRTAVRKKLGGAGTAGITRYAIRAGLIRP